jgi:hypothetical protein
MTGPFEFSGAGFGEKVLRAVQNHGGEREFAEKWLNREKAGGSRRTDIITAGVNTYGQARLPFSCRNSTLRFKSFYPAGFPQ